MLQILESLLQTSRRNIKSGWRSLFKILQATTLHTNAQVSSSKKQLVQNAYGVLQLAVKEEEAGSRGPTSPLPPESLQCLTAFAQCGALPPQQSLEAIQLVMRRAEVLKVLSSEDLSASRRPSRERRETERDEPDPGAPPHKHDNEDEDHSDGGGGPDPAPAKSKDQSDLKTEDLDSSTSGPPGVPATNDQTPRPLDEDNRPDQTNQWFPLLRALSALSSDNRKEVRNRALTGLFELLQNAEGWDRERWKVVFSGVIFPLFEDIQLGGPSSIDNAGKDSAMFPALTNCIDLFADKFHELNFLFPDLLAQLSQTVTHATESVGGEVVVFILSQAGFFILSHSTTR